MASIKDFADALNKISLMPKPPQKPQRRKEPEKKEPENKVPEKKGSRPAAQVQKLDFGRCWRYNYGLLSQGERKIYEEMEKAILGGVPEIIVSCPFEPTLERMMGILIYLIEDNPVLFYVNNGLSLATRGREAKIIFSYNRFFKDREKYLSQMKAETEKIYESELKNCKTQYEIENAIHDYFVKNVTYDPSDAEACHSPIGPLLWKKGVCEGIAEAVGFIACACGLDVAMISGKLEKEAHRWNIIRLDGKNYHLDITSDLKMPHSFLNCNDKMMQSSHSFTRKTGCTSLDYNYYMINKSWFGTLPEAEKYIGGCAKSGQKEIEFYIEEAPQPKAVFEAVSKYMKPGTRLGINSSNNGHYKITIS